MKQNEISQAAKEFHKSHFKSEELSRLEVGGYIQGMIMVNEKQPYSRKDLESFSEWLIKRYKYDDEMCMYFDLLEEDFDPDYFEFDELLKRWEETK